MAKLLIEIERPDGWRRLTTVSVDGARARRDGVDEQARAEAERHLAGWRGYFGFGERLRITEVQY
jgi:hypothetical protein